MIVLVYFLVVFPRGCISELVLRSTKIECTSNPKFLENVTCYLKSTSSEQSLAQLDCYLIEPLRNPTAQIKFFKKDITNRYKPFLINISFNVCDVIAGKSYLPYGISMWKTLKKFSNANHSCPFVGHLFARDLVFEVDYLPPTIPMGIYWISVTFLETYAGGSKGRLGTVNWYLEVMRTKRTLKKHKIEKI